MGIMVPFRNQANKYLQLHNRCRTVQSRLTLRVTRLPVFTGHQTYSSFQPGSASVMNRILPGFIQNTILTRFQPKSFVTSTRDGQYPDLHFVLWFRADSACYMQRTEIVIAPPDGGLASRHSQTFHSGPGFANQWVLKFWLSADSRLGGPQYQERDIFKSSSVFSYSTDYIDQ